MSASFLKISMKKSLKLCFENLMVLMLCDLRGIKIVRKLLLLTTQMSNLLKEPWMKWAGFDSQVIKLTQKVLSFEFQTIQRKSLQVAVGIDPEMIEEGKMTEIIENVEGEMITMILETENIPRLDELKTKLFFMTHHLSILWGTITNLLQILMVLQHLN